MGQVALLEEREKTSEASVKALEREMSLKLQTMDLHKSKVHCALHSLLSLARCRLWRECWQCRRLR